MREKPASRDDRFGLWAGLGAATSLATQESSAGVDAGECSATKGMTRPARAVVTPLRERDHALVGRVVGSGPVERRPKTTLVLAGVGKHREQKQRPQVGIRRRWLWRRARFSFGARPAVRLVGRTAGDRAASMSLCDVMTVAELDHGYRFRPALAGMTGGRRAWTVSMISLPAIPRR